MVHSRYKENNMQTRKTRRKILVTVAVVALTVVAASAATAQFSGGQGPEPGDGTAGEGFEVEQDSSADAVYVREDGSGVLVYNGTGDTNGSVTFGADMSTGLLHLIANGTGGEGFDGDLSFEAEPTSWMANGSFRTDETGMLEDLNLDVNSRSDDTDSSFDAQLDATVSSGLAALAPTATTEGEIVTEPDRLTSSGSVSYQTSLGGGSSVREVRRFDLSQDGESYVLDSRERRVVRGEPQLPDDPGVGTENGAIQPSRTDPAEDWGTRERAEETLNEQYTAFADNVSATADLTLESYSFENVTVEDSLGSTTNESLIDVEYTVEYTGVQEGIAEELAENVSSDVSQETADELAQGIRNLSINQLSFATVSGEDGTDLNWSVDVENYNDLFTSFLRLSSEMEPSGMDSGEAPGAGMGTSSPFLSEGYFDEIINMSQRQMEAAEAAGLVSRWEWSGSLESEGGASSSPFGSGGGSGATATVTADISHTTENWESYVTELENRGVPMANSSFELTATTTDGGVEGSMDWETNGEALAEGYQTTLNAYESALRGSDEVNASVIRHVNESGLRVAKMDATVSGGSWDIEAGAAFDNGTALSAAIETVTGYGITQVVGTTEEGTTSTYVKSDALVNDPTEDAVRSLEAVGDDTSVNLPGEWDRDFPEMDTASAADYLGVEESGAGGNGSPLPGFGALVALVALAAVAVGIGRRD
jgi:PGF-CTERM protein